MTRNGTSLLGRAWVTCGALAALLLAGCPPPDGGGDALPPDICNSLDEALTNGQCALQQATNHLDFISVPSDKDFFSFTTPATMDARSLLRVTAGYGAPATPVQLALNILRQDGTTSLGRVVDKHGQGAPAPLAIVTRFTEPNARLVLLLSDQPDNPTQPQSDPRNNYLVKWDVGQDPDPNEPNDTTPTAITLSGTPPAGSATGILATQDDQDAFSFPVAAGKVLYFHLSESTPAPKPLNFRLAWSLFDPAGTQVGEGRMDNVFQDINLATARLIQTAGTYKLVLHAYREPNAVGPLPGDERLTYKIDVTVYDQLDANEPNDSLPQANGRAVSLALGTPRTFNGRIGYVGDPDWYAVDLPANTNPTVLHYKLNPPAAAGRFPPLPLGASGLPDREVVVVTEVTQGTTACQTDATVCPKGYGANPNYQLPVEQVCARTPAQCLWSDREEDFSYPNLKNFEGRIPVAPHGSSLRYYVVVQDVGNDWADDATYALNLTWEADPDEASRFSGGVEQTPAQTLAQDTGSTFPVPPGGATLLQGTISHGYGRLYNNDPTLGQGIRGPGDYDAVATDIDRFELDLPFIDPAAGPLDRTWELQWSVAKNGGTAPHGLFLEVEFCDGTRTPADGGTCSSVTTSGGGGSLTFAYDGAGRTSWWNFNRAIAYQPLYDLDGGNVVTARAYGCFCFEPRFVQGGKLFVKVGALDRETWDVTQYSVRTAFTSYPQSFVVSARDAGTASCPVVNPDAGTPLPDGGLPARGGCEFTK